MSDIDFYGWVKTSKAHPQGGRKKVRVRRADGSRGYAFAVFDLQSYHIRAGLTQEHWEDLDGTLHNKDFYAEWAFLIKDGGLVK